MGNNTRLALGAVATSVILAGGALYISSSNEAVKDDAVSFGIIRVDPTPIKNAQLDTFSKERKFIPKKEGNVSEITHETKDGWVLQIIEDNFPTTTSYGYDENGDMVPYYTWERAVEIKPNVASSTP